MGSPVQGCVSGRGRAVPDGAAGAGADSVAGASNPSGGGGGQSGGGSGAQSGGRRSGAASPYAIGCCCVMQWMLPSAFASSSVGTCTTVRRGNRRAMRSRASSSAGSPKPGSTTPPFAR
jgi:hypothetical protein